MMYALVSQEIISGNGISLPIIYDLRDNYVFINGAVPFVLDPPFFPILLALLGGVTSQSFLAAQIINVISHVAISIFTFLIMKKSYANNGIALLTAILVSFSYPLLWDTHRMLTESLFSALIVAAVYFLILSRNSDKSIRNLFVASTCTSAAILTKYAGLSLLPVFFWGTFILVKNKSIKSRHVSTILTAILPIITAGALFIRTYIISGSIHGWIPPSPERSYLNAFTGTIKMIFYQFDLGERYVALITIVLILFILFIILNTTARRELSTYVHSGLDLIIVFAISHTVLISHAMAKSQTVFELRYMSPLVPFLFIVCILLIVVALEMIRRKGFSQLSLFGIILLLGIITFGNLYKTYLNSGVLFSKQLGHYRVLDSPTYNWIKENYGENVIIATNRPYHLSFFGGYSTIRLPHKRFEKNSWIPDNMESFLPNRMSKMGSRVLALFEEVDEQHEGNYLAGLFSKRKDDGNFVLIQKFPDGVVYNLKE
jgi:4-amino-4-deoxy-L-arabinose transferase-like glycosyltransferase